MSFEQRQPKRRWVMFEIGRVACEFDEFGRVIAQITYPDFVYESESPYSSAGASKSGCSSSGWITSRYSDADLFLPFSGGDSRCTLVRVSTDEGTVIAECVPIQDLDAARQMLTSSDDREEWETEDGERHLVRWYGEHRDGPQTMVVRYFDGDNLLDIQTVSRPLKVPKSESGWRRFEDCG